MAPDILRSKIVKTFKLHGLTLRSESSTYLQSLLRETEHTEVDDALSRIIDALGNLNLPSAVIDKATLESAVNECNDDAQPENSDKVFNVINVFHAPKFKYNSEKKKLLLDDTTRTLFGTASDKTRVSKDRYLMVMQRTIRHKLFTPPVLGMPVRNSSNSFTLQTVEQVLGNQGSASKAIVLAMIVQIKEGRYSLEDPTGHMECSLVGTKFHHGMFTEFTFILAEGIYNDTSGVFEVSGIGLPPSEPPSVTRNYFGNTNFFGGPSSTCVGGIQLLKDVERQNPDNMFVVLSDIWLDQQLVLDKLRTMFRGYSRCPPFAFVFFGNFSSGQSHESSLQKVREGFVSLAEILSSFPQICTDSHFLIIPGPGDPGIGPALPRPPLVPYLVEPLAQKLSKLHVCSNPARVQYCSQEIVLFRENLINKMCRHSIRFPDRSEELHVHFAKTLLSQGHLTPLPLHVVPVYWSHDHALRLYPIPDMLILADKYDAFSVSTNDCLVFNPGSFPKSNFSFKVYLPGPKKLENCEIGDS